MLWYSYKSNYWNNHVLYDILKSGKNLLPTPDRLASMTLNAFESTYLCCLEIHKDTTRNALLHIMLDSCGVMIFILYLFKKDKVRHEPFHLRPTHYTHDFAKHNCNVYLVCIYTFAKWTYNVHFLNHPEINFLIICVCRQTQRFGKYKTKKDVITWKRFWFPYK